MWYEAEPSTSSYLDLRCILSRNMRQSSHFILGPLLKDCLRRSAIAAVVLINWDQQPIPVKSASSAPRVGGESGAILRAPTPHPRRAIEEDAEWPKGSCDNTVRELQHAHQQTLEEVAAKFRSEQDLQIIERAVAQIERQAEELIADVRGVSWQA